MSTDAIGAYAGGPEALACDVVLTRVRDATRDVENLSPVTLRRNSHDEHQRKAVAWLASRRATRWFDAAGVDQEAVLQGIRWCEVAVTVLREGKLTREERSVILETLEALQGGGKAAA